jgi:hypothetical protein
MSRTDWLLANWQKPRYQVRPAIETLGVLVARFVLDQLRKFYTVKPRSDL